MKVIPKRFVPVRRLLLRLAAQRKRLCVKRRVAADPEDSSVRLAGVEAAKVTAPATAKSASSAESATTRASKATEVSAALSILSARQDALGAEGLDCVAYAVRVEAGQRTHCSRLAADGHRIFAKVGVAGNRRQRRSRQTCWPSLRLRVRSQRAHQAQVQRAARGHLANGRLDRLVLLLLDYSRGQRQLKIDRLIVAALR